MGLIELHEEYSWLVFARETLIICGHFRRDFTIIGSPEIHACLKSVAPNGFNLPTEELISRNSATRRHVSIRLSIVAFYYSVSRRFTFQSIFHSVQRLINRTFEPATQNLIVKISFSQRVRIELRIRSINKYRCYSF